MEWIIITTIIVVIIGIVVFFLYKENSDEIEKIKQDIAQILSQTENIERYTIETNNYITKKINLEKLKEEQNDIQKSINELVEDLHYRKRLSRGYINIITNENTMLEEKVRRLECEKETLMKTVKKI